MSGYSVGQHKFRAGLNADEELVWKKRLNMPEEEINGLSKVVGGGGASVTGGVSLPLYQM